MQADKLCKMEVCNKFENNVSDLYSYDATTKIVVYEQDEPHYNIHIIFYIKEEDIADKSDLINIGVLKPTSANAIKDLRI